MLIEESLLSLQIRRSSGRSDLRSSPELNPHLLESYWYSVYAALFDIFESDSYISMLAPQFTVSRTFCQETGEVGHHPKPSKRHPRYPQVARVREDSAQANAHSSLPGESRAPVTIAGAGLFWWWFKFHASISHNTMGTRAVDTNRRLHHLLTLSTQHPPPVISLPSAANRMHRSLPYPRYLSSWERVQPRQSKRSRLL